ncbi:acyl-CoA thioesterase [Paraburkholderia sp. 32]|uniref:acyl-CoA thioesterase n=1 Tax=Paraburkholderia sp. 32 TaxID=2991057 RepID=UPI003D1C2964
MRSFSSRQIEETAYGHWSTDTVRWSDTDRIGHVNHLALGAYFETGRSRFIGEIQEPDQMFVTAALTIDFIRELHWPDPVRIGTAVMSVGQSSCKVTQGLFSNGRCIAVAAVVLVLIDASTRQPVAIPDLQRSKLKMCEMK